MKSFLAAVFLLFATTTIDAASSSSSNSMSEASVFPALKLLSDTQEKLQSIEELGGRQERLSGIETEQFYNDKREFRFPPVLYSAMKNVRLIAKDTNEVAVAGRGLVDGLWSI